MQEMFMILFRVVGICFVTCMMLAPTEVNAQDKADQLRAVERARLRSLVDADVETARRLHTDDFELINPVGGTLSKEQYLRDVASGELDYLEWEPGEIRVRLYGDSAVIRYRAHLRVSVKGSAGRAVTFWHTDLYEKRDGRWQIVWAHATQVQQR
jgi:ketosteroid isomerase-like protein